MYVSVCVCGGETNPIMLIGKNCFNFHIFSRLFPLFLLLLRLACGKGKVISLETICGVVKLA